MRQSWLCVSYVLHVHICLDPNTLANTDKTQPASTHISVAYFLKLNVLSGGTWPRLTSRRQRRVRYHLGWFRQAYLLRTLDVHLLIDCSARERETTSSALYATFFQTSRVGCVCVCVRVCMFLAWFMLMPQALSIGASMYYERMYLYTTNNRHICIYIL